MNFKEPLLEKVFKRVKWSRNNTIEIFDTCVDHNVLNIKSPVKNQFEFQTIIYQFQCIITTTDSYFRKTTGASNQKFGIYVKGDSSILKKDIKENEIKKILSLQLDGLEEILKEFDYEESKSVIDEVLKISDHEYLHQGELILMLRENNIDMPERFKKAWAI